MNEMKRVPKETFNDGYNMKKATGFYKDYKEKKIMTNKSYTKREMENDKEFNMRTAQLKKSKHGFGKSIFFR